MKNHDELMNLGYVAYDHVSDFREEVESRDFIDPSIELGFFYDGETPVLNAKAIDLIDGEYDKDYRLEGMSIEAFESEGYDIWTYGFADSFEFVEQIGEVLGD